MIEVIPKEETTCQDDTIYRQAAIEAIGEQPLVWTDDDDFAQGKATQWEYDIDAIKALPPAQSKTCEYWDRESNFCALHRPFAQPEILACGQGNRANDFEKLIKASDLIEWIMETYPDWCEGDVRSIVDHVEQLPSAQPMRKRGKWIYGEDEYGIDGYRCDKCGFFVPWDYAHTFINYIEDYKFCPNCGADMRGEGDEVD